MPLDLSPPPKALLFDIFGTTVNWRKTVVTTLHTTAHSTLNSATASLATSVRLVASSLTLADWARFAQQWRNSYIAFVRAIAADPSLPFKTIDAHHLESLQKLLADWKLDGLWSEDQVAELNQVWHRLEPWGDAAQGLQLLNKRFATATLSNGNLALQEDLVRNGGLPFTHVFSGEMWGSYKPNQKVYLGAVERLGLRPEECVMVAAHLDDLKGARGNGLRTVYVEREAEEGWSEEEVQGAKREGWVDLWVGKEGRGFVDVAEGLGVELEG